LSLRIAFRMGNKMTDEKKRELYAWYNTMGDNSFNLDSDNDPIRQSMAEGMNDPQTISSRFPSLCCKPKPTSAYFSSDPSLMPKHPGGFDVM